ncbi:MAG: SprT family zinc-dependent metalloprotease [Gemella sp.]|nr:SprT family zinc-dependent metalloprotease [Gemella sp.]
MKVLKINEDLEIYVTKRKSARNMIIRVDKKSRLCASIPYSVKYEEVMKYALANLEKIYKMLDSRKDMYKEYNLSYADGEIHYLWGEEYELSIVSSSSNRVVIGDRLEIYTKSAEKDYIKNILDKFYKKELMEMIDAWKEEAEDRLGVSVNKYRIRDMTSRWGTCNITKKIITLNLQLAKKEPDCLEAVFYHELVHLLETNHTKRFYDLMDYYYPHWREVEKRLHSSPYKLD